MARLTTRDASGVAGVDPAKTQEAIQRLAGFEDYFECLLQAQAEMERQLDQMRAQGKQKSVRFREVLGKKMLEAGQIAAMRTHRID